MKKRLRYFTSFDTVSFYTLEDDDIVVPRKGEKVIYDTSTYYVKEIYYGLNSNNCNSIQLIDVLVEKHKGDF